jgi:hypothetical protein
MTTTTGLRGRWAQGLQPATSWVIMDQLGGESARAGFAANTRCAGRKS